ncbi:hypothetical protein NMQ01_12890 [Janibacter sp. CX7]|uniref:DUF6801 domain-containing protein n=1 Tax=Janibacter sp. CX7 TaxID=2963431 RepID=UPI0020CE93D8|nr:DUF6801 domain-containing protein [Janibacter sp. CX7]UTT65588.1 hypothetical protein NMQ01_12890 [Janibacter sp. CX7]
MTSFRTRASAGAALVTGLGMIGIAAATPASAEVTGSLDYSCKEVGQNITFTDPWTVDLTLDVPETVEQGETIPAGAIKATVTPGADATQTMQGLGVKTLEGTAATTYTFGEGGEARDVALTVPKTDVPATGTVSVDATGESTEETAPAEDVNVPITAGDFTAELANQDGFIFKIECTAPEDATVGTVAVGDAEPPAEEPEPPADGGDDPATDDPATDDGAGSGDAPADDAPAEEPAGDAPAGEPEVPGVVQTDDAVQSATSPTAIALGGLLLAAAGASTVVVARRRTQG